MVIKHKKAIYAYCLRIREVHLDILQSIMGGYGYQTSNRIAFTRHGYTVKMDDVSISEPLTAGIGNMFGQLLSIGLAGLKHCTMALTELSFVHDKDC